MASSNFKALQEKMKAELESLTNRKSGDNADKPSYWFKPQEGKNTVRIIPVKGQDLPFIKLLFHFGINGKNNILSPRNTGDIDPIADFSDRLIKDGGGKLTKEEFKAIKKNFSPQLRTYVPIVVRGKEDEGIKFWAFGEPVYKALLSIYTDEDEDYGNIADPESGFDLTFDYTPKDKSDTGYAKTENVKPKRSPSVLTKNEELLDQLLNKQPVLIDQFKKWTAEELNEELRAHLEGVTKRGPMKTSEPELQQTEQSVRSVSASVPADVEEEFERIFNS